MFDFFKKKDKPSPDTRRPITVLCIPGNWKDRTELITSIITNNPNDYIMAGMLLLNRKTNQSFEIELYGHDDRMRESFRIAGMVNKLSDDFLDEINQHQQVVYLSAATGNTKSAKELADAANALLNSGGIGVKVETTGKAFSKEQWSSLLNDFQEANLYKLYVLDSISDGQGTTYTCGMHNLGLKDSIVHNEDFQDAVYLLSVFGYYRLLDKPKIFPGQTFSTDENSPIYELIEETKQPYLGDELFENPYGMWQLVRLKMD